MTIKARSLLPWLSTALIVMVVVADALVSGEVGAQANCLTESDLAKTARWTGTWGSGGHWTPGTIYVYFPNRAGQTTDRWTAPEVNVVMEAFSEWQTIIGGNIRFVQVSSETTATLKIRWEAPFLGQSGVWGAVGMGSQYWEESNPPPNAVPSMIAFNPFANAGGSAYAAHDHKNWFIDPNPAAITGTVPAGKADLRTVAKHEIGHALGLPHSDGIMSVGGVIKAQGGRVEIGPSNITAITALYKPVPLCPVVTKFVATFIASERSTHYSVTATDPNGGALTYAWSRTNKCGLFGPTNAAEVVWNHPDEPGGCPVEPVHPGTITLVVSNAAGGSVTCQYDRGSASGNLDVKTCAPSK